MKLKILILAVLLLPGIAGADRYWSGYDNNEEKLKSLADAVYRLEERIDLLEKKHRNLDEMVLKIRAHLSQPRAPR